MCLLTLQAAPSKSPLGYESDTRLPYSLQAGEQ